MFFSFIFYHHRSLVMTSYTLYFTLSDEAFSEDIWGIIELAMAGNPRKTRRFINSFSLAHRFLHPPDKSVQQRIQQTSINTLSQEEQNIYLAELLVFQMNFPEFYRHLQYNPGDWEYLVERVPKAKSLSEAFIDHEKLKSFWDDSAFVDFINRTSGRDHRYPAVPGESLVMLLLQATNMVVKM